MFEFIEAIHWGALLQIVVIDILLGGDNAVVIALACRNLAPKQRMQGIVWGTAGAIGLRVVLIAFALTLLTLPFIKLVGGALLVWIGIKLLVPEDVNPNELQAGSGLLGAIKTIIIADFVMSLDNVLAIAAAANNAHLDHQIYYVVFGLLLSVPIIVWGSTIVLRLIDRLPIVITLGAALLGWIAGGMLVSDVIIVNQLAQINPDLVRSAANDGGTEVVNFIKLAAEISGAIIVVILGRLIARRNQSLIKEHV